MSGLTTNDGKKIILDRAYNSSPTRAIVSKFKVGTDSTAATVSDTDLGNAVPITGTESVDDCETADWTDSADMTTALNSTTYKEGSNSLDLTKDAGAAALATTYKTTTSVDFTSKQFSIWVYIKDSTVLAKLATTDALIIRFGSDDSNYYEWKKDNADFTAGQWNLFQNLTSANADSTTGTPVLAAMDYTYIGLTADAAATTWSDGDIMMDDIKLISSDDFLKSFESGYPSTDFTAIEATIRTRINTINANGYPLTEVGIFNEDGTPLMESRDVYNLISKTDEDEVIYQIKTQIT